MEAGVELLASLDKHGSAARHHNFGSWLLIYMKNGGTFPTTPGPFSTFVSLLQFPDLIPYMIKPLHDLLSQTSDQLYAGAEARVRKAIMETLLQDKVLPLQPEWVVRPSSMPVAARAEDLAQRSMVPMLLTLLRLGRKICIETRGEGGSFLGPAVELARLLLPMEPFVERFASSEFVNSMLELTQIMILHFEDCVSSMLASSICALSCALLPNMQDAVVTRVSHNSADLAATARRHLQAGGQALWSFPALVAAFAHRHEIPGDAPQLMMDIIADSKQAPLARIQAMTTMGVIMDIAPQLVSEELLARLLACVPNMVGCLRAGIPQMGEDECVYAMTSVAFHLGWLKALGSRHPAVLDDAVKAGIVDVLAEMLCADTRGLTSAGIQLIWLWVKQPNALGGYIENSGLECVMQALVAAKQSTMLGHCLQHLHGEPIDCLLAGFSAFLHVAEQATRPSDPSSPANILESYGSFLALFKRLAAHQPSCFDRAQAESLGQLLASLMTAVLDYKRGDVLAILLDLCSLDEARRFVTHEPLWQELVQLAKTKRKHKQAKAKAKQAGPRAEHDKQAEVAAEAAMRALLEEEEQDKARLERVKAKQGRKKGGQPVAVDKTSAQEAACPAMLESLCCSITQALPVDPVIAADGYTYERFAIEAWLRRHSTSPMLNTELPHCNLMPNMSAKALIASIARQ
ncbi:hypothetical protein WJX72_006303 [[Myrmecia] bisecta]|uniref:U-box domain-containing protein n=1 Tax=[Myrmecia] bisecta TaxID=41462 RepID=A0AAW1QR27_9CHLO